MPFSKEDLVSADYTWDSNNLSLLTGSPSRRPFNRYDGNQVLLVINTYVSTDSVALAEGRRMEDLIRYCLPQDVKSEISAYNWLKNAMQQSKEEQPASN